MFRSFVIFCLLLSAVSLQAQWAIEHATVFGGAGDENLVDLVPLENGNVLAAGYSSSFDGQILNFGQFDYWLAEITPQAEIVWQTNRGGGGMDRATAAALSLTGTVWIAGRTDSTNKEVQQTFGKDDVWLIEVDAADGSILRRKTIGGTQIDRVADLQVLQNGRLALVGHSESNDGDFSAALGGSDAFILLLDAETLTIEASVHLGGSDDDRAVRLQEKANGDLLVVGDSKSADGDFAGDDPQRVWLAAFDSELNPLWSQTWGGSSAEVPHDLAVRADGSFFIAAETASADLPDFHGLGDVAIAHFDAEGNLLWEQCYGGSSIDSPRCLILTPENELLVVGYTFSLNGDVTTFYQASNVWLMAASAQTGELLRAQVFGGNNFEEGSTMHRFPDGNLLVLANTDSFDGDLGGSGKWNGERDGNHDAWLFVLQPDVVGRTGFSRSGEPAFSIDRLTSDELSIASLATHTLFVELFTSTGQLVRRQRMAPLDQATLSIGSLPRGIYALRAGGTSRLFLKK